MCALNNALYNFFKFTLIIILNIGGVMALLITAVGLVLPPQSLELSQNKEAAESVEQSNPVINSTLQFEKYMGRYEQAQEDATRWGLPVYAGFQFDVKAEQVKRPSILQQIQKVLAAGRKLIEEGNADGESAETDAAWIAIVDLTSSVLPTALIEHISTNAYGHQLNDDVQVICLHDRYSRYPLLSIFSYQLINEVAVAMQSGSQNINTLLAANVLGIAMPEEWV